MSPIFHGPGPRPPIAHVMTVKYGRPEFIQFLGDPSFTRILQMHYLPLEKRTVPCLGDECRFHTDQGRWTAYAPVLNWHLLEKIWKRKILLMTSSLADLTLQDQRYKVIELTKTGAYNTAPFRWKVMHELPVEKRTTCEPWDVEPDLLKMWGMFATIKKPASADLPEGATLPFPTDEAAAGKAVGS